MILKQGQIEIPLHNDVFRIEHVLIYDVMGLSYPLMELTPTAFEVVRKKERAKEGRPTFWCQEDGKLKLYPRPEREYPNFRVGYVPALRYLGEEDQAHFGPGVPR